MASKLAWFASLVVTTGLLASACASSSTVKDEAVDETTQDLTLKSLKLVGSLDYGQTSQPASYAAPRYTAFKFAGQTGDDVEVWVRSNNGDPVTWILDNDFRVVAKNDDASASDTNSHIKVKLPANASATHYVIVRDYWRDPMSFTVELTGPSFDGPCNIDADCVKVSKVCCSELGQYIAVAKGKEQAYKDSLACPQPLICPKIMQRPDYQMAQCNRTNHTCELVQPSQILCGGFVAPGNQHDCPAGYQCRRLGPMIPDLPGRCYQFCGGIAGIACHEAGEVCVDDPADDCDPKNGGADCGGICKKP